jgi:hypothetical protein
MVEGSCVLPLSTLSVRQIETGYWVIDATSSTGVVNQLAGAFLYKAGADRWIVEHPAEAFMPVRFGTAEPLSIVAEPQDVLSLHHKIELLERNNALLKEQLLEVAVLKEQLLAVRRVQRELVPHIGTRR